MVICLRLVTWINFIKRISMIQNGISSSSTSGSRGFDDQSYSYNQYYSNSDHSTSVVNQYNQYLSDSEHSDLCDAILNVNTYATPGNDVCQCGLYQYLFVCLISFFTSQSTIFQLCWGGST